MTCRIFSLVPAEALTANKISAKYLQTLNESIDIRFSIYSLCNQKIQLHGFVCQISPCFTTGLKKKANENGRNICKNTDVSLYKAIVKTLGFISNPN